MLHTLPLVLDVAVVLIILINVIIGARKGFVKTIYSFVKFAVSAVCAFVFSKPLAEIIKTTEVYRDTESSLIKKLCDYITNGSADVTESIAQSKERIEEFLSSIGTSLDKLFEGSAEGLLPGNTESVMEFSTEIVEPVLSAAATVVAFIAIFIAASIVLFIVMKILDLLASAPVINKFNTLLGAFAGAVIACLFVFIIIMLVSALTPFLETVGVVINQEVISATYVYRWFKDINPLALALAFFAA